MKQLTCEMCGGVDLIKQDGVFVCQNCGMKYSVEEAKKMMIEGTVDIQGTVKVDNADKLENYYKIARRARNNNDEETAAKYYELIFAESPNDWEASLYRLYFSLQNCKLGQMENNSYKFANSLKSIFELADKSESVKELKLIKFQEIEICTLELGLLFRSNFLSWAKGTSDPARAKEILTKGEDAVDYLNIILGDCLAEFVGKEKALKCWKNVVSERNSKYRQNVINRIKKLDPDYEAPEVKSGCYVATCVYGSYDCPQVWTLRRYRDNTLGSTWYGRAFIKFYYAISPTLVKWFGKTKWFKKMWKGKLDKMVKKLQDKGVESTPYNDKEW